MKIQVESSAPLLDFTILRDQLVRRNEKFSPKTLAQVPYEQLFLCGTGEAGAARCDRHLVVEERRSRRSRFINMETDELEKAKTFLLVNQMNEDVKYEQTYRTAPTWESLNSLQKTWAKLNCIVNHVDDPHVRLKESLILLRQCALDRIIPPEVAMSYMPRLRGLLTVYPGRITDSLFRSKINEIAESLFEFLEETEAVALQKEEIQGYSCTSDCYRVLV